MKKLFVIYFLLMTGFCFSAKQQQQQARIHQAVERIIQSVDPDVNIGMKVISLKTGEVLYEKNAGHLLIPASCAKLFTAGAALFFLGENDTFETELLTNGSIEDGVLYGNLYLKGSGDPSFTLNDLEELVRELQLLQIRKIEGDIVVDPFEFDEFSQGPGWMWDDPKDAYWNSCLDGMMINHSCMTLWVKPADQKSLPPKVFVFPKAEYIALQNSAETGEETNLQIERKENRIQIHGKIAQKAGLKKYEVALDQPHFYAASLLKSLLVKNGISFAGSVKVEEVSEGSIVLASHRSPTVSLIVRKMLKDSDNLYANALFKRIGKNRFESQGSWQSGSKAVREFLEKFVEMNVSQLVLLDGCGQSRYNLVSAHQIVTFLKWINEQFSLNSEFVSALPIAGVDGTLKERMKNSNAKYKVRAKPGSLAGISSISGYLTTQDNEPLAFSILINGFTKSASIYKIQLEDAICTYFTQFSRNSR